MNNDAKKNAAKKAIPMLVDHAVIGMGTGSTVECLLDELCETSWALSKEYVVSSERTYQAMLKRFFKNIRRISEVGFVDVYVDGADWIDRRGIAIKGYGGALTQEKLIAAMAPIRIAIVDASKVVPAVSGLCEPLPLEVLPMGRSYVARKLIKMGCRCVYREGTVTDQGNEILDIYDYLWDDPLGTERELKAITGVVESGLFARDFFHSLCIGD